MIGLKRKIQGKIWMVSLVTLVLTVFSVTIIYYQTFQETIQQTLENETEIICTVFNDQVEESEVATLGKIALKNNSRITLIKEDGTVAYDSVADPATMSNHNTRPEVMQAREHGSGHAERSSGTIGVKSLYYAVLLDNGYILRVSQDAVGIVQLLGASTPFLLGVGLITILISYLISRKSTKNIVAPIENMAENLDSSDYGSTYKELAPFIRYIQNQHKEILESSKIRQEFTANVSHELKTPLTAISGYAELIENNMVSEEDSIRFAKEIHKNADRLVTLINDIINLSSLDDNDKEVPMEWVNLYDLTKSCMGTLSMAAKKRDVSITLNGSYCGLNGNTGLLEEMVYNLCDNAIRYNHPGGRVLVTVTTIDGHPVFSVQDTGIGISKENQERIFERFYRVDKSRSKATGGTGLGLAIVKHIVEKHHAELEIHSALGTGTQIRVIF